MLLTHNLPFKLDLLPPDTYLVGGAVRDALLNRKRDYLDLDFVLPQGAIAIARNIAKSYQAGFVVLDQQRQIARVVFKDGTVDFAQQEGDTLETDLKRRDFTINAIAYNPHTSELIDPFNGLADLKAGLLRMIAKTNLEDDPLRLLRAYRQAGQLNFNIEPITRSTIISIAILLGNVAAERVRTELTYLLSSEQGDHWLKLAIEDGLLTPWLKSTTPEKIKHFCLIDTIAQQLQKTLNLEYRFPSQVLQLAKLTSLVADTPEQAQLELMALKYSRAEIRAVTTALSSLPVLQKSTPEISLREQYFLFLEVGDIFPILALLASVLGVNQEIILPLMYRYLNPSDTVAHPQPLVTGNDLLTHLNLRPSPQIGKLLTELQIAQIEGKIATLEAALNLAKSLLGDG